MTVLFLGYSATKVFQVSLRSGQTAQGLKWWKDRHEQDNFKGFQFYQRTLNISNSFESGARQTVTWILFLYVRLD